MDGDYSTVGGKSTGRLQTLCTLPPLPHNTQRPNSKSLIGGIKSTFTVLLLLLLALFYSIFSLLFHSIFGGVIIVLTAMNNQQTANK
jgi:hypothetical protein